LEQAGAPEAYCRPAKGSALIFGLNRLTKWIVEQKVCGAFP
jgi:hypothetical protein